MAGRISLQGKKFSGDHSSYTNLAGELVKNVQHSPLVKKISAGIIKTGLSNVQGNYRIKIIDEGACLLLRVRGNITLQEVRIFQESDKQSLIDLITKYGKDKGIQIQANKKQP